MERSKMIPAIPSHPICDHEHPEKSVFDHIEECPLYELLWHVSMRSRI